MARCSDRLEFRQIVENDRDEFLRIGMDELAMQYITGKALNEEESTERFDGQLRVNAEDKDLGFFLAIDRNKGQKVGYLKIVHFSETEYEIGYLLKPEFWNRGYASEMLRWITVYAAGLPAKKSLVGIVSPQNIISMHILTKHGFVMQSQDENRYQAILRL